MALETGTYISDLVAANPDGASPKSSMDDHLRLIKSTIKTTFPNVTGAMTMTHTQLNTVTARGLIAGQTWTGTHQFPATTYGVTAAFGASGTGLATLDYVNAVATNAALPGQTGSEAKFLRTNGTTAAWSELGVKGANIASAATINLTTATGDYVHVTGTTTITAITIPVGAERTVIFDGVLTLTHGAALLLPGAANITTAANDRMMVRGDTAGAIVTSYTKADGTPIKSGMVYLGSITPPGGGSTIDFLTSCSATYDTYFIDGIGLISSADDALIVRVAVAGAAVTASDYATSVALEAITSTLTTGIGIGNIKATATCSGRGTTFTATLQNVNTVTALKTLTALAYTQYAATPSFTAISRIGSYIGANVITGFRLYCDAGATFDAGGVVRVYGISKT